MNPSPLQCHTVPFDIQPPYFSTCPEELRGVASTLPVHEDRRKGKNPVRSAAGGFAGPLRLCRRKADGVTGHHDSVTGSFWVGAARTPIPVTAAEMELPVVPPDLVIPATAIATQYGPHLVHFIDFGVQPGAPCVLYIGVPPPRLPTEDAVRTVCRLLHAECADGRVSTVLLGAIPHAGKDGTQWFVPAEVHALGSGHLVCSVSFPESCADHVIPVCAARACAAGFHAFPPVRSAYAALPVLRVQSDTMQWVKDTDVAQDLARAVDFVPGMTESSGESSAVVLHSAPALRVWDDVVYDADMNVCRAMVSWATLAAVLAQDWTRQGTAADPTVENVCEPLASYIHATCDVQARRMHPRKRAAAGREDMRGAPSLTYNSPQRITDGQAAHAMAVYYWTAVYADEASRPFQAIHGKRVLEAYLRFGHILLKKRSYKFRGTPVSFQEAAREAGPPTSTSPDTPLK